MKLISGSRVLIRNDLDLEIADCVPSAPARSGCRALVGAIPVSESDPKRRHNLPRRGAEEASGAGNICKNVRETGSV